MKGLNRFLIFVLLLALLYALYMYQQQINTKESVKQKPVQNNQSTGQQLALLTHQPKSILKQTNHTNLIDDDSINNISIDNVSQLSIGSYDDHSVLSGGSSNMDFLDDNSVDSSEESEESEESDNFRKNKKSELFF